LLSISVFVTGWVLAEFTAKGTGWVLAELTAKGTGWVLAEFTAEGTGWVLAEFTADGSNRRTVGFSGSYSTAALSLGFFSYISKKSIAFKALISDFFSLGSNGDLLLRQRFTSQKTMTFRLRAV
jgi:hypothetical protein